MSTAAGAECFYATLGVPQLASQSEIKKAYMNLAKKYHPDRCQTQSESAQKAAHDRFAAITAAFDVLGDRFRRQEYDLRCGTFAGAGGGGGGGGGHRGPSGGGGHGHGRPWEGYQGNGGGGFQQGSGLGNDAEFAKFHTGGESPYKVVSDNTIVWLCTVWMVAGALFHYFRFKESHEEVQEFSRKQTQQAANHLSTTHRRARENGAQVQLEMLREHRTTSPYAVPPSNGVE